MIQSDAKTKTKKIVYQNKFSLGDLRNEGCTPSTTLYSTEYSTDTSITMFNLHIGYFHNKL